MNFDTDSAEGKGTEKLAEIKDAEHTYKYAIERKKFDNRSKCLYSQSLHSRSDFENEQIQNIVKQSTSDDLTKRQIEQEEKLAQELDRLKREEIKELKMRHLLRQNSIELKELEAKLRTAYVTKELSAQLAEKECERQKEKMYRLEADKLHQQALMHNLEAEKIEMQEEFNRKIQYKQELQDQMIFNYKRKQNMYEEFLMEKKIIDDIIQQIHAENEREMEEKMNMMNRTKEEIRLFKEAQEIWRQKERKLLQEENERLENFLLEQEIKQNTKIREEQERKAMKEKLQENLAKSLFVRQEKIREREQVIQDLLEEEYREMEEVKLKNKIKRDIQKKIEMQKMLEKQTEQIMERQRQEQLEDRRYREQLLAKIAEDEKIDQLTAEKKRLKMIELRRTFEETIKENRIRKALEMKKALQAEEEEKLEHENRKKLIEEERIRLLQEHVSNLIGYLPPGVLRPDDLPRLGSDITNRILNNLG